MTAAAVRTHVLLARCLRIWLVRSLAACFVSILFASVLIGWKLRLALATCVGAMPVVLVLVLAEFSALTSRRSWISEVLRSGWLFLFVVQFAILPEFVVGLAALHVGYVASHGILKSAVIRHLDNDGEMAAVVCASAVVGATKLLVLIGTGLILRAWRVARIASPADPM